MNIMINKKKTLLTIVTTLFLLLTASCSQLQKKLDVIGNGSIVSFETLVTDVALGLVKAQETNAAWSLAAPDGGARFLWNGDFGAAKGASYDIALEVDALPFINAGLDISKLPDDYIVTGSKITVGKILGVNQEEHAAPIMPIEAYKIIVDRRPDVIGYHVALGHYGVDVGGGNMFEWARNVNTNDKDIVFVLDPQPFVSAGVNPQTVEGWLFAKIPVHSGGKKVEVDKFLKPFHEEEGAVVPCI